MTESSTRLFCLWAREASVGVVFRRGPTNLVQLLKWNLESDELVPGQWFKGRIYERRCDLSPCGDYLIYFAANHKAPYGIWSAISRPPYLTALALWPNGDTWDGGGLFDADGKGITLSHHSSKFELAKGFSLPANYRVRPYQAQSVMGEPIFVSRLQRDGWRRIRKGKQHKNPYNTTKIRIEYVEPEVWEKCALNANCSIHFELHGMMEIEGPFYVLKAMHIVEGEKVDLGRCDWADIKPDGTVYYSSGGELIKRQMDGEQRVIADLSNNEFYEMAPTPEAKKW